MKKKWLFFLLGLFSTMPIVGIVVAGRDISLYQILFSVIILVLFLENSCEKRNYYSFRLVEWLVFAVASSIIGVVVFYFIAPQWSDAALSHIPKILLFLMFAILWASKNNGEEHAHYVIKVFFIGCIINCLWACVDALDFYITGQSINNILFQGYCIRNKIHYGMMSLVSNGSIRACGFNYDPAHIGFLSPIVASYGFFKRKPIIAAIGFIAALAAASTTAIASCALAVLVLFVSSGTIAENLNRIRNNKIIM